MEPGPWCVYCESHIRESDTDPVEVRMTTSGGDEVTYLAHSRCLLRAAPAAMRRYVETYWPEPTP